MPESMDMISIVIPVRDGMPWIEEQLRALVAQECPIPWEIVVADNGSTDGTVEFVQEWARTRDNVTCITASTQRGASAARNAGVAASRGNLLAFCDADDVVLAGWLAGLVEALATADLVAGVFDFGTLNEIPAVPIVPAASRQLGFLPAGLGANLAVRREAFLSVDGFDEQFVPGEDIDLCWRLQLKGFTYACAWSSVVAKRDRPEFRLVFSQAYAYGRSGPALYRRYRGSGARRNLAGAVKSWIWLVASLPSLGQRHRRVEWARAAGTRIGRLDGSLEHGVFFP